MIAYVTALRQPWGKNRRAQTMVHQMLTRWMATWLCDASWHPGYDVVYRSWRARPTQYIGASDPSCEWISFSPCLRDVVSILRWHRGRDEVYFLGFGSPIDPLQSNLLSCSFLNPTPEASDLIYGLIRWHLREYSPNA
jgi:hypothetical protein